ncbi:hypothetical protein ASD04_14770 [Devosia sp. Root436]|nr:hypothetical protein ASD04_14770 [Devosia sp. Root436]
MTAHPAAASPIIIADDFSRFPGGRYRADGDNSGEEFREDYLVHAIDAARTAGRPVTVVLDGVAGYPASFLEEAFGGLVREGHFTKADLRKWLVIEASSLYQTFQVLTWSYIDQAKPKT